MAELQSYRICKLDYSFYGQCTKSILYILEVLWLHCYMQTMWPFMRHQWTDCNCFWINVSLTSFLPFPKFFYPTFFKIRLYISISLKIWHFVVQKRWNDSVRSGRLAGPMVVRKWLGPDRWLLKKKSGRRLGWPLSSTGVKDFFPYGESRLYW